MCVALFIFLFTVEKFSLACTLFMTIVSAFVLTAHRLFFQARRCAKFYHIFLFLCDDIMFMGTHGARSLTRPPLRAQFRTHEQAPSRQTAGRMGRKTSVTRDTEREKRAAIRKQYLILLAKEFLLNLMNEQKHIVIKEDVFHLIF